MLTQRVTPSVPPRPIRRLRPQAAAMLARCITALFGGYAAAAALAMLTARLLPVARVEATLWSMIASFLVFACLGLWAFHEPRLARVVGAIWGIALVASGGAWLLGVRP